jgi:hypothetical protein
LNRTAHTIYILLLSAILLFSLAALLYAGTSYYQVPLEERYFHDNHQAFKPSGVIGHGLGVFGSLAMLIGVGLYMARKRFRSMARLGLLKHWLEFHIFLCTLGPILVLFHTTFKFGGIVAISFWSMVAVFASGIIGRFIYIQIPRTIEGRELSLGEVREMKKSLDEILETNQELDEESRNFIQHTIVGQDEAASKQRVFSIFSDYFRDNKNAADIKSKLKRAGISKSETKRILKLVRNEMSLSRRINRLSLMQELFRYWHVAHLPFALVMIIIMLIHIGVTITFGAHWIF